MRWLAFLSLLVLTGGGGSNEPAALDLTPPVRLLNTSLYMDGGTIFFVLSDARGKTLQGGFDGRMQFSDATCPPHCFLGGDYPTKLGVRLLPLWGSEERKLVHLLATVISDTASHNEVQALVRARSGVEIPSKFKNGLWNFICAVEGRRQTLEAIDHGLLAGTNAPYHLFSGDDTARAESLVRDRATNRFVVTFRDAEARVIRIGYPASMDSVISPASFSGDRFDSRYVAGSATDRMMVTKVSTALGETKGNRSPSVNERDRSALLDLLKVRTAKILEADKDC